MTPTAIPYIGGDDIDRLLPPDDAVAAIRRALRDGLNPAAGLLRIHAVYVLFGAQTPVPRAILDGAALTALRTPAVSVPMRDIVTGEAAVATDRPVFFKGSGMSWQDLVVADAIFERA